MLVAERMTYGFRERPDFLQSLSLTAGAGQCWGIIGPNGAGKSTLLRLLAGLRVPSSGQVLFRGSPLATMPMNRRATQIAFLPQQLSEALGTTAVDVALMGRYPHRRFGLFEDAADRAIADSAMVATGTLAFAGRQMSSLSGGEARRVHIAAALAQQPSLLLLDEPTAALDLYHQLSIFQILAKLAAEEGLLVMVVTHDINLAARFCTHVLLLDDGRCVAAGSPAEVMNPALLESVYHVQLAAIEADDQAGRWVVPVKPNPDLPSETRHGTGRDSPGVGG